MYDKDRDNPFDCAGSKPSKAEQQYRQSQLGNPLQGLGGAQNSLLQGFGAAQGGNKRGETTVWTTVGTPTLRFPPHLVTDTETRVFDSGATRNGDTGKLDYEGFYSPLVVERFARYMDKHRHMENGERRASDNWQKGIPKDSLIQSAFRHFHDWWMVHRGNESREGAEDAICGLLFNAQAYLLALLKERGVGGRG